MAYLSQIKLSNTTYDISAYKLKNARTLTIGNTGKSFNGSTNVSWNHKEMGVLPFTEITESQDADSLITSGLYSLHTTATTNVPITNNAFLLVGGQGDIGTKFQIFIADSSNTIYKRSYNNTDSAWRDWSKSWDIDITGRAGHATTATNVAWSGVTSKPSYYDAKAIKGISRSGTTFTYTCMDGTTGTFTQQDNNTTYSAATTTANGLMTAAMVTKLNGIASGATKVTIDSAMSTSSTNPVQNKVVQSAITSAINSLRDEFANGSW